MAVRVSPGVVVAGVPFAPGASMTWAHAPATRSVVEPSTVLVIVVVPLIVTFVVPFAVLISRVSPETEVTSPKLKPPPP